MKAEDHPIGMMSGAEARSLAEVATEAPVPAYDQDPGWQPAKPRLSLLRLLVAWMVAAASVWVAAEIVPGFDLEEPGSAFVVAATIAVVNAFLPPLVAALRLPFTLVLGFLLVLFVDALALVIADELLPDFGGRSTRSGAPCSPRS